MAGRIAIIGAGMAGLACGTSLAGAGHEVHLFDKARGPGGRMSTRRVDTCVGEASFDHGAQYFTARDAAFVRVVAGWEEDGHVARWPAAGADAWVGTPGMNAPVRALAAAQRVHWSTRVDAIAAGPEGWLLRGEGIGGLPYHAVLSAVPAEQVSPLLAAHAPAIAARAQATPSQPCWTLMLAFDTPLAPDTDVLRDCGAIGWACRNANKPGRGPLDTWVVQATPAWSTAHLEDDADAVAAALTHALQQGLDVALPTPLVAQAHRWRYARSGTSGETLLWDGALRLGACGDWLAGPRVECAWLSGTALAQRMLVDADGFAAIAAPGTGADVRSSVDATAG